MTVDCSAAPISLSFYSGDMLGRIVGKIRELPRFSDSAPTCGSLMYILNALSVYGFAAKISGDRIDIMAYDSELRYDRKELEGLFKAISRAVEPGTRIEYTCGGERMLYLFLFDTVERWTHPRTFFAKQEAI